MKTTPTIASAAFFVGMKNVAFIAGVCSKFLVSAGSTFQRVGSILERMFVYP
jgi:hypothetical protein